MTRPCQAEKTGNQLKTMWPRESLLLAQYTLAGSPEGFLGLVCCFFETRFLDVSLAVLEFTL